MPAKTIPIPKLSALDIDRFWCGACKRRFENVEKLIEHIKTCAFVQAGKMLYDHAIEEATTEPTEESEPEKGENK